MSPTITDNRDQSRFEIRVDDAVAGFTEYRLDEDRITFTHTEVGDAWSGQGLGQLLAAAALDAARDAGLAVLPKCEFVAGYIQRHREYVDLVPEEYRSQFGL